MERRFIRNGRLVPLLAVLLLGASAAAPRSEQDAAREARTALDRAELRKATAIIDDALSRFKTRDSEAVWTLRVLRAEALIPLSLDAAGKELEFDLPQKYGRSATAVQLLIMRALANPKRYSLDAAEKLAAAYQKPLLGDVYLYRASLAYGDPARGLKYAREARRLARQYGRPIVEAKAIANLALHLGTAQRYPDAVDEGERAVALAKTLQLPKVRQAAEGNLGWAYFELGHFDTAEELFRSAEKTAKEISANRDRVPWLIQLGNIEFQKRNWRAAADFNAQAAALAPAVSRPEQVGYAYANLARIAIEEGRWADATRFNAQALEAKGKGDVDAVLSSKVVEARIAMNTGNPDRAQKMLEEILRQKPGTLDTLIEAESYLATLFVNAGQHDQARKHFKSAVRAAHEGHDSIADQNLRLAFFNRTSDMFDAYVDFVAQHGTADEALAVMEASRAQSLKEGDAPRMAAPTAIARANNATILYYWLGRRASYVWTITPDSVTKHALPPDTTIEQDAKTYLAEVLGPRPEAGAARGKRLFATLVPVRPPKGSRVIIIADGQLHTLPFDTLVTPEGRYWIEDVTVLSAPLLQREAHSTKTGTASPSILLVGDAPRVDPAYPPLKFAHVEISRVAAHFDRHKILHRAQATPAAYLAESKKPYDFIHLAAHGVATRKRPLDSAVILARDTDSSYRLYAHDIVKQPLDARLVTISSCHGAGTRTYAGEGVVGLAWAFLKAGADQVIAALWEVNDAATPDLMDRMYAEIRKGRDPADALRIAKLQMVQSKSAYQLPRYWAPFVLYSGM